MSLQQRIAELAADIRDKFNNLIPFGRLTSVSRAKKSVLSILQSSGDVDALQDALYQKSIAVWLPAGFNTTATMIGMAANSAGTGTLRSLSATNIMTSARRIGYVSSAAAGSVAYIRDTWTRLTVGQGGGKRGFFVSLKFGVSDAAPVATASMFAGLHGNTNPWGGFNPLGQSGSIGVGCNAGDANLSVMARGDTGVAHVIDLGPNFPANSINSDWYHLTLFSPSSEQNRIYYRVSREGTPYAAEGELIPGSYPPATATMGPVICRMNNSTALSVGFDVGHIYSQVDN